MKTEQGKTAPELIAKPGEYVIEYQLESERGFHFMGSLFFSSNTRFPGDPAHFTSISGEPLGTQLTDFEVPDDSWVWTWSRWYVDMTADVDDQGWCYAWRFGSNQWSGRHRFMRSFVRQRVWKRPRIKRYLLSGEKPPVQQNEGAWVSDSSDDNSNSHSRSTSAGSANDSSILKGPVESKPAEDDVVLKRFQEEDQQRNGEPASEEKREKRRREIMEAKARRILRYIKSFRNDREKVDGIIQYISTHPGETESLVAIREQISAQLSFSVSKVSSATKLSESTNENCQLFIMAPSNTWRDLVSRRGEPERETIETAPEEDDEGAASTSGNISLQ